VLAHCPRRWRCWSLPVSSIDIAIDIGDNEDGIEPSVLAAETNGDVMMTGRRTEIAKGALIVTKEAWYSREEER
jgi:hypothetical protein